MLDTTRTLSETFGYRTVGTREHALADFADHRGDCLWSWMDGWGGRDGWKMMVFVVGKVGGFREPKPFSKFSIPRA